MRPQAKTIVSSSREKSKRELLCCYFPAKSETVQYTVSSTIKDLGVNPYTAKLSNRIPALTKNVFSLLT